MRPFRTALVTAIGVGAYSLLEPYLYRLAEARLPVARTSPSLTLLHISDTHMKRRDRRLREFLTALPLALRETPDLVVATGDLIEGDEGIDPLLEGLAPLRARLGCYYVLGSHDYYAPRFTPLSYFSGSLRGEVKAGPADTARLEAGLCALGWRSLTNTTHNVETPRGPLRLAGIDDPFLRRHRTDHIARSPDDVAAIGVMHCPDVVSEWFLASFDLVVAGHTHGGQVRVPGLGALVTNCSLPNALAGGPHRVGEGWLHVSPGLGTGKYSPIRFRCRPEATLLRLEPMRCPGSSGAEPVDARRQ
jgi:predicted MPP superfamily phosphohydrolase